jgi:hypothetical protein
MMGMVLLLFVSMMKARQLTHLNSCGQTEAKTGPGLYHATASLPETIP